MAEEGILSLLRGRTAFTTGTIVFIKPYYIKGAAGRPRRIGYKLSIDTERKVKIKGEAYPVLVSAFGKKEGWHSYRRLMRRGARVSVSGLRKATKVYENERAENGMAVWVILKRSPPPNLALVS
jgi:hypothetical protein